KRRSEVIIVVEGCFATVYSISTVRAEHDVDVAALHHHAVLCVRTVLQRNLYLVHPVSIGFPVGMSIGSPHSEPAVHRDLKTAAEEKICFAPRLKLQLYTSALVCLNRIGDIIFVKYRSVARDGAQK